MSYSKQYLREATEILAKLAKKQSSCWQGYARAAAGFSFSVLEEARRMLPMRRTISANLQESRPTRLLITSRS